MRIKNGIIRRIIHFFGFRWSSKPFITGDGFRRLADHIYDETGQCRAEDIVSQNTIFVQADMLDLFFLQIHPKIACQYKLITHNSDRNILASDVAKIDEKIITWFAQNVVVEHPKLIPIPFGLDNFHWYHNGIPGLFRKFSKLKKEKRNRILYGFSVATNTYERQPAYDCLSAIGLAEEIAWTNNPRRYLEILTSYKFIASPPGNGLDAPRQWQAMYVGVVPIVKKSAAMDSFKALGLPIWVVTDWEELKGLTENDLAECYKKIMDNANTEPLFLDYWIKRLREAC